MTATLGFVTAAAQLGLNALIIKPNRSIGFLIPDAVFEEEHTDHLEITEHPVEYGSVISDHAYRTPAEVTIKFGWSSSPNKASLLSTGLRLASSVIPGAGAAAAVVGAVEALSGSNVIRGIYAKLLELQKGRELFYVETGKRSYPNMLIKTLSVVTDQTTENSLVCTAVCREVIIARTTLVTLGSVSQDPKNQANPKKTGAVTDTGAKTLGPSPNYNPTR